MHDANVPFEEMCWRDVLSKSTTLAQTVEKKGLRFQLDQRIVLEWGLRLTHHPTRVEFEASTPILDCSNPKALTAKKLR
jgi:hypothetical protein